MFAGYEVYDKEKEYVTKDGKIYSEEMFRRDYPAVVSQKMAVYVYGNTITQAFPLAYLRGINGIENSMTDGNAMMLINERKQLDETENTPLERIAASLEYLVLLFMGNRQ